MELDFNENTFVIRKKKMPVPKKNFTVVYSNNKIYIIGVIFLFITKKKKIIFFELNLFFIN